MAGERPIAAAAVGLGWWGKHIVRRLAGSEKIRITCAVDPDAAGVGAFAAEQRLPLERDLGAVLARKDIDAVILATPHSLHETQAVAAANAGKHVFCEKPLSLAAASAARIVDACRTAKVVLGVGHERRFEPALIEIKRLVDSGALGTIMHVEANFNHDKLAGVDPGHWRLSPADAPAAGMTGMGVHLTDAYIHMFGAIASVYALTARRVLRSETGDVVSVLLRFKTGLTGYVNAILATPHHCRLLVYGSEAWVEALNTTHPDTPGPTELTICRKGGAPETRDYAWTDTVRANLEAFADAVAGRAAYPYSEFEKLHNVAVLEAVARSAATGAAVALPDA